jgi:hypothetical protein
MTGYKNWRNFRNAPLAKFAEFLFFRSSTGEER